MSEWFDSAQSALQCILVSNPDLMDGTLLEFSDGFQIVMPNNRRYSIEIKYSESRDQYRAIVRSQ